MLFVQPCDADGVSPLVPARTQIPPRRFASSAGMPVVDVGCGVQAQAAVAVLVVGAQRAESPDQTVLGGQQHLRGPGPADARPDACRPADSKVQARMARGRMRQEIPRLERKTVIPEPSQPAACPPSPVKSWPWPPARVRCRLPPHRSVFESVSAKPLDETHALDLQHDRAGGIS